MVEGDGEGEGAGLLPWPVPIPIPIPIPGPDGKEWPPRRPLAATAACISERIAGPCALPVPACTFEATTTFEEGGVGAGAVEDEGVDLEARGLFLAGSAL